MEELKVIKLGGKVISDKSKLEMALKAFANIKSKKILIHGGGNLASNLARSLNIEPIMVEGRRVTDQKMLEIVTMVYGGSLNKKIVAVCQSLGVNGIGLSGADGNIILSERRPVGEIDYGHVGDIRFINVKAIISLLNEGFIPVICALTHDGKGNILNTNADTIASELSRALSKQFNVELIYGFEFQGVMQDVNDAESLLNKLDYTTFERMKNTNHISAGMIPKLDNAFHASVSNVSKVFICSYLNLHQPTKGTMICKPE